MDKKKLSQLLTYVGGAALVVIVILWFIPTITYDGGNFSPLGYFAIGFGKKEPIYNYMLSLNENYNTNSDMYWLAFGTLLTILTACFTVLKTKKISTKIVGTIVSVFMLAGVILSPVMHLSAIWVLYLIFAIIAVAAFAYGWVIDAKA